MLSSACGLGSLWGVVAPHARPEDVRAAGERVQRRGLPGAVRAEHGDDLAVAGAQRQVEVEVAAREPQVRVEAHRSHRPRSARWTATATASMSRLSATAVCGSSWSAT